MGNYSGWRPFTNWKLTIDNWQFIWHGFLGFHGNFNFPFSIVHFQLKIDPIALRALPLQQGKFLVRTKKRPCFRGAPRRGEGSIYTMCNKIQAEGLSGYSPGQRPGVAIPSSHQALKGRNMGFIMKGFQPKNTCYANNPGRCPGLYHFRLSAYILPKSKRLCHG